MKFINILLYAAFALLLSLFGCNTIETNNKIEENRDDDKFLEERSMEQFVIYELIKETVAELNENSNLYIYLLTLADKTEYASHFDIEHVRQTPSDEEMLNEFDIRGEDDMTQGTGAVRPFPWVSDDLRVIYISWTAKGTHHVFGIDVGDNLENAREKFHVFDFVENDTITQSDWHIERYGQMTVFERNHVDITIFVREGSSEIIYISVFVHDPFMPIMESPS